MSSQRESVKVLQECIDLQIKKSADYQNPNSNIKQAMHYRRGVSSIHDMIAQKLLRAQSLIEPMENGEAREPNFESLEDTYKDLINYASFAVSYIRGKMEGQNPSRDMFNRHIKVEQFQDLAPLEEGERMAENAERFWNEASSRTEEIEDDGFITVVPSLFAGGSDRETQEIKLNPGKETTTEEKIKSAYFREVAPKGEITMSRGVVNCTDNVQHSYVSRVINDKVHEVCGGDPLCGGCKLTDIGDRIEGEYDEHMKRISER